MKYVTGILLIFIVLNGFSQDNEEFKFTYHKFPAPRVGYSGKKIISIEGRKLTAQVYRKFHVSNINFESDTLGKNYWITENTVHMLDTIRLTMRNESIDSIRLILNSLSEDTIKKDCSCWSSIGLESVIVRATGDSLGNKLLTYYQTFDSTALEITNIIINYLPDDMVEFRPIREWQKQQEIKKNPEKSLNRDYLKDRNKAKEERELEIRRKEIMETLEKEFEE